MRSLRPLAALYLGLAVLGTLIPLAAFLPWLSEHGLNIPLFVQQLFTNRISAFFGWDVIISALVVLVATFAQRRHLRGRQQAGVVVGTLLVGVSLGLPLLLFHVERSRAVPLR